MKDHQDKQDIRPHGRPLSRRDMLTQLARAAGAGSMLAAGRALGQARPGQARPGQAPPGEAPPVPPACVLTPQQTEGPYFVDERLHRSDLRGDPSDSSVRPGVPLLLALTVSIVGAGGCRPLPGAVVDIWHCDAAGAYSDTRDPRTSTLGKKFLRGYQVTDKEGLVRFVTIYPGWYPGRAVHVHFKIRSDAGKEFTSQLYFDDAVTARVHANAPYARQGSGRIQNGRDGLYRDGGERLLLRLTESGQGYVGSFHVGLKG